MVFGNANIYLINVFIVSSPTLGPFNVKRAVSLSSAYKLSYCSGSELFVQMLLLTEVHYYVLYIVALRTFLLSITTTIAVLKNGNVYLAKYLPLKTRERSNLGRPGFTCKQINLIMVSLPRCRGGIR